MINIAPSTGPFLFPGTTGNGRVLFQHVPITAVVTHVFAINDAVFVTGQLMEGYVVVPRLVGERIGLHPLAVIFALLAFGQVFGFLGLLLALPASAVLLVALRRAKALYFHSQLYKGQVSPPQQPPSDP